jgi:hypothetical protein
VFIYVKKKVKENIVDIALNCKEMERWSEKCSNSKWLRTN